MNKRIANVICEYQNVIPPESIERKKLRSAAVANDDTTVDYWRETWLKNIRANKEKYGSFKNDSFTQFFNKHRHGTAIIAGSGPSLRNNVMDLKKRGEIPLISCLHNFHYFEDNDINPDYYVSLDAGKVTLEEVSEGGTKTPEEYYEITKKRKLLAFIGTDPDLLANWKGEIYFFNCLMPNKELIDDITKIERFNLIFSTGGNVLGGCLYFARAILGCFNIIFTGADFSFGYPIIDEEGKPHYRFHPWKSKYDDKLGQYFLATDIYGHKVPTWQSYFNFKCYFDMVSKYDYYANFINCTEGGCLGAYPEGNIASFKYMDLKDAIFKFNANESIREVVFNPELDILKTLYE